MAGEGSTIPAESVVCEASSSSTLTTTIPNRRGKREFTGTRQVPRFNRNLQQHERSATALDRPGRGAGQIRPRSLFTARTDDYHGHVDSPFVPVCLFILFYILPRYLFLLCLFCFASY